ncbi:uncharacterized protein LOC105256677 [Camponotus floridanus]|uniref:uncharacterized protein LOC105256677 n=1 Tax=Camponotus floridanus TaxID=104421 RepID=UPI000DC69B78|nr:uncharacterized protein LOC105256677 [Camponotus floridanus]
MLKHFIQDHRSDFIKRNLPLDILPKGLIESICPEAASAIDSSNLPSISVFLSIATSENLPVNAIKSVIMQAVTKMISDIARSNIITSLQQLHTRVRSLELISDTVVSLYCNRDTRCLLVNIIENIDKNNENNEKNFRGGLWYSR